MNETTGVVTLALVGLLALSGCTSGGELPGAAPSSSTTTTPGEDPTREVDAHTESPTATASPDTADEPPLPSSGGPPAPEATRGQACWRSVSYSESSSRDGGTTDPNEAATLGRNADADEVSRARAGEWWPCPTPVLVADALPAGTSRERLWVVSKGAGGVEQPPAERSQIVVAYEPPGVDSRTDSTFDLLMAGGVLVISATPAEAAGFPDFDDARAVTVRGHDGRLASIGGVRVIWWRGAGSGEPGWMVQTSAEAMTDTEAVNLAERLSLLG